MSSDEFVFPISQEVRDMFIMHEEPKKPIEKKTVSFKNSVSEFIKYVNENKEKDYRILNMCECFHFQRRRFYDVINTLEALGACRRNNPDTFEWYGMDKIPITINEQIKEKQVDNPSVSLDEIMPQEERITISKLTINFILCFAALKEQALNLHSIATFLSRNNGRFKTTLCKLYQIVHILVLAGVVERRDMPSEVELRTIQVQCPSTKVPDFIEKRRLAFGAIPAYQGNNVASSDSD